MQTSLWTVRIFSIISLQITFAYILPAVCCRLSPLQEQGLYDVVTLAYSNLSVAIPTGNTSNIKVIMYERIFVILENSDRCCNSEICKWCTANIIWSIWSCKSFDVYTLFHKSANTQIKCPLHLSEDDSCTEYFELLSGICTLPTSVVFQYTFRAVTGQVCSYLCSSLEDERCSGYLFNTSSNDCTLTSFSGDVPLDPSCSNTVKFYRRYRCVGEWSTCLYRCT